MKELRMMSSNRTFKNEDISKGSYKLTEAICSDSSLRFGSCEASKLKVRIRTNADILGEEFTVGIVEDGVNTKVGKFTVFSVKPTADRCYKDVELYDSMYQINTTNVIEWYNGLTFPITLKNFRDSFFNHLEITQATATLVNDSMTIEKTIDAEFLAGKAVITAICELNGCFGHINSAGAFEYVFLGNSTKAAGSYKSCKFDDFVTHQITKLTIRESKNDIGASAGTDGNEYAIENNFICYGKGTEELQGIASNVLGVVSAVAYRPFNAMLPYNMSMKLGDKLSISTEKCLVTSYLLKREVSGVVGAMSTISAKGTEKFGGHVNTVNSELIQLRGKSNTLERSIEETRSTITNLEGDLNNLSERQTSLEQSDSEIKASVSLLEKRIDQEVETYEVDYEPTLYNYPAMDWVTSFPVDGTIPISDTTVAWTYTEEEYKKHLGYVAYARLTNTMYRFSRLDDGSYGWKAVVNSDMSYVMNKVAEIDIKVDGITQTVAETYETKSSASSEYSKLSSQIKSTKDSIELDVSKKYQTLDGMSNYTTSADVDTAIAIAVGEINLNIASKYQTLDGMSNYSTTEQMNSAISLKEQSIMLAVSSTYETKQAFTDSMKNYSTTTQMNSAISVAKQSIEQTVSSTYETKSDAGNTKEYFEGKFTTTDKQISAKVSSKGGSSSSFGWDLVDNGFSLYSGNKTVFKCDSNGIEVNGKITTTSGKVAGWSIEPKQILNQTELSGVTYQAFLRSVDFFGTADTSVHAFAVEKKVNGSWQSPFYVDYNGKLHAENAEISGYTTTSQLDAATARIGVLEANYITADNINSKSFVLGAGHIGNLDASKITSGTISADRLDANSIGAKVAALAEVNANRLACSSYKTSFNGGTYVLTPISIRTQDGYFVVLGAKQ